MADADGKFTYSKTVMVTASADDRLLRAYPNPAKQSVTIQHSSLDKSSEIKLIDVQGRIVKKVIIRANSSQTTMHLNGVFYPAYMY